MRQRAHLCRVCKPARRRLNPSAPSWASSFLSCIRRAQINHSVTAQLDAGTDDVGGAELPFAGGGGCVWPCRLFGRDTELAVLDWLAAQAAAGTGGAVLLCGEPGIGKTRLARETTGRARGAVVSWGACRECSLTPPQR